MQITGVRLDTLGSRMGSTGVLVEASPVSGDVPALVPAQRLSATILERNGQQAVIDLKGTQLSLPAQPGWDPGMELSITVTQVTPKLLLEVSPRPVKTPAQLPPLILGQEVKAKVIEELSNGSVLVSIEEALLEAETPTPLLPGKSFTARVEQLRPQVILHILPGTEEAGEIDLPDIEAEATHLLRVNLAHRTVSAESLNTLTQELASFVGRPPQDVAPPSLTKLYSLIKTLLPDHAPPTAEHLAAFVRDGGLHYESKLFRAFTDNTQTFSAVSESDLKGLLLQALKDLEMAQVKHNPATSELLDSFIATSMEDTGDIALPELSEGQWGKAQEPASFNSQNIATSLAHHLENIESQQAVNVLAQVKGEPYQLQIPFFTGQGMTTAFLSVEPDKQGDGETNKQGNGEKRQKYNILFMLDLDGFGQTRIDARIGDKSLWVAFYVDQNSSISLLQRELPAFRETIRSLGYEEVLLVAKPLGQIPPEKREKFEALSAGAPISLRLLDVKA